MNQSQHWKPTTDMLKGIALAVVLINHYLNLNINGDFQGFSSIWISIFFLMSGFGLFHSMENRIADIKSSLSKEVLLFYYDRFVRIFPLYWLALLVQWTLAKNGNYDFWVIAGIHGEGHYWFIASLLQCYVLCPFLYFGIKRNINIALFLVLMLSGIISFSYGFNFLSAKQIKMLTFIHLQWRGIWGLNMLLFTFGLFMADYLRRDVNNFSDSDKNINFYFWFFALGILILMIIIKYKDNFSYLYFITIINIPILLIVILSNYALRHRIQNSGFSFLGSIAYSIYLFHKSFYFILDMSVHENKNSLAELFLLIILFPLFVILCNYIEKLNRFVNTKMRALVR